MGMARYAVRRLLQSVPVLIGIATITFLLINSIPGDPIRIMVGPNADASMIEAMRARYGLDEPLHVRYVTYLGNLIQGDMGRSIHYGVPVSQKIAERLPVTLLLLVSSFTFAIATAVPMGVYSAQRRNELPDHLSRILGLIGVSTPSFWIGLMLIIIFSFHTGLLPSTSLIMPWADPATVDGASTASEVFVTSMKHLIMPTITLGTLQMAAIMRVQRSSMLEVLQQDYVQLARAYGIRERTILRKHAFRNAQLPVITIIGLQITTALGGSVLTETVFNINGMGRLIITAINNQDYPLVMGTTLFFGFMFVVGVIVTDLSYAYIDPRVTYDEVD